MGLGLEIGDIDECAKRGFSSGICGKMYGRMIGEDCFGVEN